MLIDWLIKKGIAHRQYLIKINYKSGHYEKFWCRAFTCVVKKNGDRQYEWNAVDEKPLDINMDEVESVWSIDNRICLGRWR